MHVEPWSIGTFAAPEEAGRRLVWTLLFYREQPDDNPYAKPIHGLHAVVDYDDMTVVRVEDLGVVPVPPGSGAYAAHRVGPLRDDLKPLEIIQPEGPSFDVRGWEVRWQRWRLPAGLHRRARAWSCTPSDTRTRAGCGRSCGVPRWPNCSSRTPTRDRSRACRNAFDIGEFGIGILANSLELGCDCLGEIRYFDVELADGNGEPYTISAGDLPA